MHVAGRLSPALRHGTRLRHDSSITRIYISIGISFWGGIPLIRHWLDLMTPFRTMTLPYVSPQPSFVCIGSCHHLKKITAKLTPFVDPQGGRAAPGRSPLSLGTAPNPTHSFAPFTFCTHLFQPFLYPDCVHVLILRVLSTLSRGPLPSYISRADP
jgi:hypothetical protein